MRPLVLAMLAVVCVAAIASKAGDSQPPDTARTGPLTQRERVRDAALSRIGLGDAEFYWADALPGVNVGHADWCGAFALWCLHQAGVALDRTWKIGSGFLLTPPRLPGTATPQIGDIAYFAHNEHHAVVVSVAPGLIGLVNGNGAAGLVSHSTIHPSQATAFFSIEPLLDKAVA